MSDQKSTYYILFAVCLIFFCAGYFFCDWKNNIKYRQLGINENILLSIPAKDGDDVTVLVQELIDIAGVYGGIIWFPKSKYIVR